MNIERTAIAYEVKTLNVNKNTVESLYRSFQEGVNQSIHRSKLNGMSASVLVFDFDCWQKLLNSPYNQSVMNMLNNMNSFKNSNGEQKIYLRLEKNLWQDANKAYFDLVNRIKIY